MAKKKTKKKTTKKKTKPKTSTKKKAKKAAKKTTKKKKVAAKKKTSKKKAAKKKLAKKTSKKKLASKATVKKAVPAAKQAAKATAPEDDKRELIPLSTPFKLFMELWDHKNENFFSGIRKLFTQYAVPGKTEAQKAENSQTIVQKIEESMRKESLPAALLEQLQERFDPDRIRQISAIFSMKPRSTIRLNVLKADIHGFQQSKTASDLKIKRCQLSPWGFDTQDQAKAAEHPVYERGLFEIEDESSQIASLLLNARPGQRVLDLCAGQGDHTLAVAAMMKNKGSLFVYDADPNKLRVVKVRAERAGVTNIRILNDSQIGELKSLDAILVDAPSSSSGLIARQPEIKWRFKADDLTKIHKLQAALLREASRKLKLGGRLIYTTSSLNLSENEGQIEHFLKSSHNSFKIIPALDFMKEYVVDYVKNFYGLEISDETIMSFGEFDPFFTILPDVHGCNGLFACVIERTRISN